MRVLKLPIPRVDAVTFSPDGAELAAGGATKVGEGRGLVVFSVGAGPSTAQTGLPGRAVADLAYSPNGRRLLATVKGKGLWSLDATDPNGSEEQLAEWHSFAVAGDRLLGQTVEYRQHQWGGAFACRRLTPGGNLRPLWDVACAAGRHPGGVALLPDGRAVTLDHASPGADRDPPAVVLRAAGTGRELARGGTPGQAAERLFASPDGETVVLNAGRSLFVWRVADFAAAPVKIAFGTRSCTGVGFLPGGLLATGNDGTVRRLDPAGGTRATYTFTEGKVRSLAVAPDGLTAAAGTDRGTVVLFDLD